MQKTLVILLVLSLFYGCSKEDDNIQDIHLTEYKVNQSYTRTFYFTQHYIVDDGINIGAGAYISSACNRLGYNIKFYEENAEDLLPPSDLRSKVIQLDESSQKELKYYLIAEIKFLYTGSVEKQQLSKPWKIVIGRMEEYVFNNKIYQHLVVIEDYQ